MQSPSARDLIHVWESALPLAPQARALMLAASLRPDPSTGDLARLPLGERDRLLFQLRQLTFGTDVQAVTTCPGCTEQVELSLNIAEILRLRPPVETPTTFQLDGFEVDVHLPNTDDLMTAAQAGHPDLVRQALMDRVLCAVRHEGQPIPAQALPNPILQALHQALERADPLVAIELDVRCPDCGHRWDAAFDIAYFLWSELNAWAKQTLREVHQLASAYGWSEADILTMSAWRRQYYLGLIGA